MLFRDLLEIFYGLLDSFLFVPLRTNPSFLQGFITGWITALILATIGRWILRWRNTIIRFFSVTQQPATRDGPIPVNMFAGCVTASLALAATAVIFTLLILFRFL
jgi:hypothetical protein